METLTISDFSVSGSVIFCPIYQLYKSIDNKDYKPIYPFVIFK